MEGVRTGPGAAANIQSPGRAKSIAGLLLLCVLWSLDSLRGDLAPALAGHAFSERESAALAFGLLALVAALSAVLTRTPWPRGHQLWACVGSGLGLFFVPDLLLGLAQGQVPGLERVAVFSLTPVFAIVLEPYLNSAAEPISGALLAALAAVAGALALFPLNPPVSAAAFAGLVAVIAAAFCIATANCFAVRVANAEPVLPLSTLITVMAGAAAIAFTIAAVLGPRPHAASTAVAADLGWIVFVDLPALWLLFWLFKRISAARMTVRFVLAPAMTALAALVIEQPGMQLRTIIGIALLAGGAAWLLLAREETAPGNVFRLD